MLRHSALNTLLLTVALLVPGGFGAFRANAAVYGCSALEADEYFSNHTSQIKVRGPSGYLEPSSKQAGGSQGGKWMKDQAGQYWLLKPDAGRKELQTSAEVISSAIYRYLGYSATEVAIITHEGVRYAAIKSLGSHIKTTNLQSIQGDKYFRQLHAFAAYLKDWDRLRDGPNNADLGHGKYALFDFGGTLGSRAGGASKPGETHSDAIGAFEADHSYRQIIDGYRVNWLPANHPWRQAMSVSDMQSVARRLSYLTDAAIDQIVELAEYSNPSDATYMKRALKKRRDSMLRGLKEEVEAAGDYHPVATSKGAPNPSSAIELPPGPFSPGKFGASVSSYPTAHVTPFQWTVSEANQIQGGKFSSLPGSTFDVLRQQINGKLWQMLPPILHGKNAYIDVSGNKYTISQDMRSHAENAIRHLDSVIARGGDLPIGLILFRGKATIRGVAPMGNGEATYEPVYLPTSIKQDVAYKFIDYGLTKYSNQQPTLILTELRVMGPGVKGAYLPAAAKAGGFYSSLVGSEQEVLLQRNLSQRGRGYRTQQYKGHTVFIETIDLFH